ncbi:MAG: hypothetical protein ACRCYQ_13420 [Nocardioides sp.]
MTSSPEPTDPALAAKDSGVGPVRVPPRQAKRSATRPPSGEGTRDRRWFLRIVGWVVLAFGLGLLLIALLPHDDPVTVQGDVLTTYQMMGMASIPFIAFGGFLLWWGYGKVGEPLVPCHNCFHINKPRTSSCVTCGEKLG